MAAKKNAAKPTETVEKSAAPEIIANGTITFGGETYHAGDRIPNAEPAQLSEAISSRLVYVIEGGAAH